MKRDAEAHAAEDKKRRELAEARNTAEQRVYQLEKLIEEHKDKLSESDRSAVQAAIDKVNEVKKATTWRPSTGRSTSSSAPARRWPSISTPAGQGPGPGAGCEGPARRPETAHASAQRRSPDGPSPRTSSTSNSKEKKANSMASR